jgi:Protein of unknown function (DUF1566)
MNTNALGESKMTKSMVGRLIVFVFALGVCVARGQSDSAILATSDFDCAWKLDGQSQGHLRADDSKVVHVSSGQHLVQATSTDGLATFHAVVDVGSGQVLVSIALKAQHDSKAAAAELEQNPTWTDPTTGLTWTRKSHGDAQDTLVDDLNYCQNLNLGGYTDWRLPTIDELAALYDQTQNVKENHIKGGISLDCCEARSGSTFQDSRDYIGKQVWYFDFRNGTRNANGTGWGTPPARALCVRH